MAAKFRVGITRDILDSRGEPAFGRAALAVLDAAPDIEWEYLPAVVGELTADHASRYDALYVNMARTPAAAVARHDVIEMPLASVVPTHALGELPLDVLGELLESASEHLLGA